MGDNDKTTVLITGASSGIGRASALYLARKGYTVVGAGRSRTRLESLASDAEAHGVSVETMELDVDRDDQVDRELPRLIERFGRIDVLVNNAGYGLWGPAQRLSVDQLRAQFETNLFGPFKLVRHVLPGMVESGAGKIINVSSVEGRLGHAFQRRVRGEQVRVGGPERGDARRAVAARNTRLPDRARAVPYRLRRQYSGR